jgi:hypothetical protein
MGQPGRQKERCLIKVLQQFEKNVWQISGSSVMDRVDAAHYSAAGFTRKTTGRDREDLQSCR